MKPIAILLSLFLLLLVSFPASAASGKKGGKAGKAKNKVLITQRIDQGSVLTNIANPVMPAARSTTQTLESLRLAVEDLMKTFPGRYPGGPEFLRRIDALRARAATPDPAFAAELTALRREALLANPLLDFNRLLVLKRAKGQWGLPTNHQCNTALPQKGYDNEIAVLSPVRPGGKIQTLFRPADGAFVGEMDLNFAADRLLFTMPNGRTWQIHELALGESGKRNADRGFNETGNGQLATGNLSPRQVSREEPDADNFDPCYLPDGRIVFASTAAFTGVPCWHGKERACSIYLMNADGSAMRQLCFDQDLDLHPSVLANGQVIFSRWDYTGIMHAYVRPLMVMNPDGTLQRAVYGSNDYYPNCLFYPRGVPGQPTRVAAILTGYHGWNRSGELVVLDTAKGWQQADGIVQRIGHRTEPPVPIIRDNLLQNQFPQYLQPYPLSDKYLLVSMLPNRKSAWGVYLVDAFDNVLPLAVDPAYDFFEPIPLKPQPKPSVIPDRVDLARHDATVYLSDVYAGPGLAGVPRGSVKRLRLLAYNFGYPGLAGPEKIGRSGPWDAMRILGTVPVNPDGSAFFHVPACTPLSVQPLDAEGKALALMRSWYTAMPGETASCVGCHEKPGETPAAATSVASRRAPVEIDPWYGPARGFDFEREVQPVLDKFCVGCHNGQPGERTRTSALPVPDLRSLRFAAGYEGLPMSQLDASRLDDTLRNRFDLFAPFTPEHKLIGDRKIRYTPAYEVLVRYIRRVNIEDDVRLQAPGEYHADTSELIQMLQKGHHGVRLDAEGWDRLITWIDLNGPCYGTWAEIAPIPLAADRRRRELAMKFGGPAEDPERVVDAPAFSATPIVPDPEPPRPPVRDEVPGWPFDAGQARRLQTHNPQWERTLDLGEGVALRLVRIPAGQFMMGALGGDADEYPPTAVTIGRDFWMGVTEITNEQFRRFFPDHFSGYYMKRSITYDGPGIAMDEPRQPAVRVSWKEAMEYCDRLSKQSGLKIGLPTEAQWEYACRAGQPGPFAWGGPDADFTLFANLADASFSRIYEGSAGVVVLQEYPSVAALDDLAIATADVASYRPNPWGLYDMHGNAAEWTLSEYRPYPYREDDGRNTLDSAGRKVVRGGSFHDVPHRAGASYRLSYPAWQPVHNVGFRIVAE